MTFLHKAHMGIVAAVALLLASCITDENNTYSQNDRELYYNYRLLNAYWIYKDSLLPYAEYEGKGGNEDFGDVVALYKHVALYDPFSHYFTPQYAQQIYEQLFTSGGGALIGIEMQVQSAGTEDTIVVKRVYPKSPAEAVGLRKGDKILSANGTAVTGTDALKRYSELTAGEAGTLVTLTVLRGEETLSFAVRKEEITLPTVFLDSLEGVPVVQVTEFTEKTLDSSGTLGEFRNVLKSIQGASAAVMDLRGNPGGSVPHCVAMADELIASGVIIQYDEHYYDNKRGPVVDTVVAEAVRGGLGEDIDWVFLADSGSASCSEILLSAVQTRLQAPVLGDTSYGKGVGQYYMGTLSGGLVGITAMQFFNQDWDSYHRIGIIPSTVIKDADSALARAVAMAQPAATAGAKRSVRAPMVQAAARALSAQQAQRRQNVRGPGGAWKWVETQWKVEN